MEARSLMMRFGARVLVPHAASGPATSRSLIVFDAMWPIAKIVPILKVVCLKPQPLLFALTTGAHFPATQTELRGFLVFGWIIRRRLTVVNYRGATIGERPSFVVAAARP